MAIVSKLKEKDLLDLRALFEQSNEDSKKNIEFTKLPDGVYVVIVKKFEFKLTEDKIIRATWTFETDESEGEFANTLQYKSFKLDSKEAMTRFLKDVRKFNVDFETLDELLETLNDQIVGTPCLLKLETQKDNPDRQWVNIIVEEEE